MELDELVTWIISDANVMERIPIRFQCQCSRERVERTLISVGKGELTAMIEEDGQAEVVCHFATRSIHLEEKSWNNCVVRRSKPRRTSRNG